VQQQPGWPAPPGYPQGYRAAPGSPQAPPPREVERPQAVRFGLGAIIAGLILSLFAVLYQLTDFDQLVADTRTLLEQSGSVDPARLTTASVRSVVIAELVISIVLLAVEGWFVWFAWHGRNWARIVLWVVTGLDVVFGLLTFSSTAAPGFLHGLSVSRWLLSLVAVVLLASRASGEWYRYRKWLRVNGRPG
jgi:magnesium-transporting ATPase (P-type)